MFDKHTIKNLASNLKSERAATNQDLYRSIFAYLAKPRSSTNSCIIFDRISKIALNHKRCIAYLLAREFGNPEPFAKRLSHQLTMSVRAMFIGHLGRVRVGVKLRGFKFSLLVLNPLRHIVKTNSSWALHHKTWNSRVDKISSSILYWALVMAARYCKVNVLNASNIAHLLANVAVLQMPRQIRRQVDMQLLSTHLKPIVADLLTVKNKFGLKSDSIIKVMKVYYGTVVYLTWDSLDDIEFKCEIALRWASLYLIVDDVIDHASSSAKLKERIFRVLDGIDLDMPNDESFYLSLVKENLNCINSYISTLDQLTPVAKKQMIKYHRADAGLFKNNDECGWNYLLEIAIGKAASTRLFHLLFCGSKYTEINMEHLVLAACANQLGDDLVDLREDTSSGQRTLCTWCAQNNCLDDYVRAYVEAVVRLQNQIKTVDSAGISAVEMIFDIIWEIGELEYSKDILFQIALGFSSSPHSRIIDEAFRMGVVPSPLEPDACVQGLVQLLN